LEATDFFLVVVSLGAKDFVLLRLV
jgi:hypothetical protein